MDNPFSMEGETICRKKGATFLKEKKPKKGKKSIVEHRENPSSMKIKLFAKEKENHFKTRNNKKNVGFNPACMGAMCISVFMHPCADTMIYFPKNSLYAFAHSLLNFWCSQKECFGC